MAALENTLVQGYVLDLKKKNNAPHFTLIPGMIAGKDKHTLIHMWNISTQPKESSNPYSSMHWANTLQKHRSMLPTKYKGNPFWAWMCRPNNFPNFWLCWWTLVRWVTFCDVYLSANEPFTLPCHLMDSSMAVGAPWILIDTRQVYVHQWLCEVMPAEPLTDSLRMKPCWSCTQC